MIEVMFNGELDKDKLMKRLDGFSTLDIDRELFAFPKGLCAKSRYVGSVLSVTVGVWLTCIRQVNLDLEYFLRNYGSEGSNICFMNCFIRVWRNGK